MKKFIAILKCDEIPANWKKITLTGEMFICSKARDTTFEIDELLNELGIEKDDEETLEKIVELATLIMSNNVKFVSEQNRN